MTCALSIFSVLDNFCQVAPLHSNAAWMMRVLHLICKAHIHILLFGSKFYILAMYVQMLDIHHKYRKKIWFFRHFQYFWYFRKYHDIFQPRLPWRPNISNEGSKLFHTHGPAAVKLLSLKVLCVCESTRPITYWWKGSGYCQQQGWHHQLNMLLTDQTTTVIQQALKTLKSTL